MADIFACLLTAEEPVPVDRAYGAVLTTRGRMEMTKAAAEGFFFLYPMQDDEQLQKQLGLLIEQVIGFSGRRNEIAHGVVTHNRPLSKAEGTFLRKYRQYKGDPKRPPGYVLQAPDHMSSKTGIEKGETILNPVNYIPDFVYNSAQVNVFAKQFEELREWANPFPLVILGHRNRARERSPRKTGTPSGDQQKRETVVENDLNAEISNDPRGGS